MTHSNIKQALQQYVNWCKSQGTGLNPSEYATFKFYMNYVYPYSDGCIHLHTFN